ncbi:MAG: SufS family cysteine desulfurase [Chlamydiales bacterium]|nr:SufS family cysteine desulfurase [Chlamydiales bacterium]
MKDLFLLREDFPMLRAIRHGKPLIYFDTAASAHKPKVMIEAITDFYENHYGTVHRAVYALSMESTSLYNKARTKVQHFLNAKRSEEIIFTRGTTESINLIASSFGKAMIQEGDEIILSESEHHSNIVPWQILCEERGAHLRFIPIDDNGEIIFEAYKKLLNERTKLVSIAHISNSLGVLHPIKKVIEEAHRFNAKVFIDAAQSAPHLTLDVQELDADFLAFSGHKVYGPTGVGILYGKYELLEQLPPYQAGGDMIQKVSLSKSSYNELPLKFEAGTPMIAEVIGLGASLDYLKDIGLSHIERHEIALLDHLIRELEKIEGLTILGRAKKKGSLVSFIVEGIHPLDLGTFLDFKGVAIRTGHLCSQTTMSRFSLGTVSRVSFGLYNTHEEVDLFITYLKEAIVRLS